MKRALYNPQRLHLDVHLAHLTLLLLPHVLYIVFINLKQSQTNYEKHKEKDRKLQTFQQHHRRGKDSPSVVFLFFTNLCS